MTALFWCTESGIETWKALGELNAGAVGDVVHGKRIDVEECSDLVHARVISWPPFCTFGRGVENVRIWRPGEPTDGMLDARTAMCGRDSVVVYGFMDGRDLGESDPQEACPVRCGRLLARLDVVVWTQVGRVADRPGLIPLTRYGYVAQVTDGGVQIVRFSREDALDSLDPGRLSKRVARRIVGEEF